jgi:hypothetical protein
MGLLDDPELQGLLQQLAVTDAQKKSAKMNALSQAGFAMMGTRKGNEGAGLGRAGLIGTQSYQNQLADARGQNVQQFQLAQLLAKQREAEAARQQAADETKQIGGMFNSAPPGGPPSGQPAAAKSAPYYQLADFYAQRNRPDQAKKALDMAKALDEQEEFSTTPQTVQGPNGPVLAQFSKRGNFKQHEGIGPPPDNQIVPLGDRAQVVDRLRAQPGTSMPYGMSPGDVARDKIDRANLGLRSEQNAIARDANNAMREVGGGQAQIKIGELSANIRKEVNALPQVKNYNAVVPIIKSAETAPDTKAGDLQLIYGVGKILDPDSVVREGEMVLVTKTGSPAQRILGYMNYLQGRGQLTPEHRKQLRAMLHDRVRELKNSRDVAMQPYKRQAEAMKLPQDQIFEPPSIDELVEQYTR